jgi:hypothetical protein
MTIHRQLLPPQGPISTINPGDALVGTSPEVVFTRDHEVIRQWAEARHAEPATGETTRSGPAKVNVNDGGAGVRFNFPGASAFRPISWDEWFENFDQHHCAFVFDNDNSMGVSNHYRIVNADGLQGYAALA